MGRLQLYIFFSVTVIGIAYLIDARYIFGFFINKMKDCANS